MSFNCFCSFVHPCSCKATQSETLLLSNGLSFQRCNRWEFHIPSWVSSTPVPSEPTRSPRDSLGNASATLTFLLVHLLIQAPSPALSCHCTGSLLSTSFLNCPGPHLNMIQPFQLLNYCREDRIETRKVRGH